MKYQLLSDKFYQARQRPGGFELISFNRQPVQSSAPWVGWTDNSDCCMNMNCPAWASSGLNCLASSLATPVGPVKTFYKSLQQTDRQLLLSYSSNTPPHQPHLEFPYRILDVLEHLEAKKVKRWTNPSCFFFSDP